MMQWVLMRKQRGKKPNTWGHFCFLCQLWQTAISSAEEYICLSLLLAHISLLLHSISARSHPSQLTKQYGILWKLDISELRMMELKMTSKGCLNSETVVPKYVSLWERRGEGKEIQSAINTFWQAANFFKVIHLDFKKKSRTFIQDKTRQYYRKIPGGRAMVQRSEKMSP